MAKIFYFNPETDLILATNGLSYTPPRRIKEMRTKLALLPSLLAEEGDSILLDNEENYHDLPYMEVVRNKNLKIFLSSDLANLHYSEFGKASGENEYEISPWGWNNLLTKQLYAQGVNESSLPSNRWLTNFKELSHRKTTISFFKRFKNEIAVTPPELHFELEPAIESVRKFGNACIKAPWSSSGRGVMFSQQIDKETLRNRINSIITNQGSVIIEKYWDKKVDCATEWMISNDSVKFIGHSIFKTDSHGHYIHNIIDAEENLDLLIRSSAPHTEFDYIYMQKEFISEFILPFYKGPLGIDMLIDENGTLNPFVELNLRNTMGHVAIKIQNLMKDKSWSDVLDNITYLKEVKNNKTWRPV